jgi:TolB-like protein
MADFFAELKRRQIYRIAATYLVVAWLAVQVVNNLAPALRLPEWASSLVVLLLLIGFPIILILAWVQQMPSEGGRPVRNAALDWALFGALALVLLVMGYQELAPSSDVRQASVGAAREASASQSSAISLAVLPFNNLSNDPEQQFFSDGMTEEITAALAKIPDLRVIARTSAFQFREQKRDIQSIGQALNASHFIEGSVRRAGTRVRITAQLIEARSGVHVWAQNYDRDLADVFAVQEEIATSIAGALNMQLGLAPGEQLVSNRSIDPESYQQYLRAKAVLLRGDPAYSDALEILAPLVAGNPNYGPAWERLAMAYSKGIAASGGLPREAGRTLRETLQPKMEAAARRAIELDPNYPPAIIWQAYLETGPRQYVLFENAVQKVLQIDADNPEALNLYSQVLLMLGRVKQAITIKQQLLELEPFIPVYAGNLADALWLDGQDEAAIAIYRNNFNRPGAGASQALARLYAAKGRFQDAADVLSQYPPNLSPQALAEIVRLLRSGSAKLPSPETLPDLARFNWVYLYVGGQPERVLKFHEEAVRSWAELSLLWHPSYAPVRKLERFKSILRAANLIGYWRERGWPEWCRPVGADDFECV